MQLRLIRFDLLILLLVSLIHVEALEKLSRVGALAPNRIAMQYQQVPSSLRFDDEKVFQSPEIDGSLGKIYRDPESRGTQRRRDTRKGPGGESIARTSTSNPIHTATILAEKFAQDALHSKEIQDVIKELTSLNGDHNKKHHEMTTKIEQVFQPTATTLSTTHTAKTTSKSKGHSSHKGQANRKHNTHRKQGRKHRQPNRRLKRHRSKKEFSKTAHKRKNRKSISRGRRRGLKRKFSSEKSVTCRRKRSDQIGKTGKNLEPVINSDRNSIGELPNFESTHRKRSHIIAQLMLTTTPDPNKKKTGDQGVEYSEYYNDNDNILLTDIGAQSGLNEAAKTVIGGKVRSVRDAADEDVLDQQYYDSLNDLEEDAERLKRNDQKIVRVMDEPSNSMEYVDNTYGPVQANGAVVANGKISDYLSNYNYIPDQVAHRQGEAYHLLSNPSAEVPGLRQPTSNQFSPDSLHNVDRNPPIAESPLNKAPPNIIPSMSTKLSASPMMNNVQSVAPQHPGVFENVVLSQLPQPHFADGDHFPYYPVSETPLVHYTNLLTSPVSSSIATLPGKLVKDLSDARVNVPDSKGLLKLHIATSVVPSWSHYDFNPTPAYDGSGANGGIFGSGIPGRTTSVAPVSSFESPKVFSGLRDMRPELSAPEVSHFSDDDGAENTQAPDQIEEIASRDTDDEGVTVKKGKKKKGSKKTKVHTSTTESEISDAKEHGSSKTTKGGNYDLLPMLSCQASTTAASSTREPANTTVIANTTSIASTTVAKATVANATVIANLTVANTTVASTTVANTTVANTTVANTTVASTTVASTTVANTTVASTTVASTTVTSTTVANTTVANTTVMAGTNVFANATVSPNTTIPANETKAIANEILNEIIDEIEEMRLENPKDEQREGLPCRLTGSWVTAKAGVRIDMEVTNHTVRVSLDHLTSPTTNVGLLNVTWNVTGFAPFKRGGPFTLLATNNHTKTLAVFVGACKVCQGIDTIEGSWVVSREPRDCRDFQMSTDISNEIFRRTRLYSAIKDKQSKYETQGSSTTSTYTASSNSSTSESTNTVHEVPDHFDKFHNQTTEYSSVE